MADAVDSDDSQILEGILLGFAELALCFIAVAAVTTSFNRTILGKELAFSKCFGLFASSVFSAGNGFRDLCIPNRPGYAVLVPGFIFLSMYAFASQAVVIEKVGPIEGMNRSQKLTSGHWHRPFIICALSIILRIAVYLLVEMGLEEVLPVEEILHDARGRDDADQYDQQHHPNIGGCSGRRIVRHLWDDLFGFGLFRPVSRNEGFDLELTARGDAERNLPDNDDDEQSGYRSVRRGYRDILTTMTTFVFAGGGAPQEFLLRR